jgi:hypothetical protein
MRKELNMINSNQANNPNPTSGPSGQEDRCMDWREQRDEWRKQRREARRRDPWHGLFLGLFLVLMGSLFMSLQMGWLTGDIWWKYLLIGVGALFIVDGLVHYMNPEFQYFVYGKFVAGVILLSVGVLFLLNYSNWWPVVLIMAGCAILFRVILRRV